MTAGTLLGVQSMIPLSLWAQPDIARLIGRARLMMDYSLRTKGVRLVVQHEPYYVEEVIHPDPAECFPAHWLLAAEGIAE